VASPLIYDCKLSELTSLFESWGEPPYRAVQLWQGLYKKFWNSPEKFTTLPHKLRLKLADHFLFDGLIPGITVASSDKHTNKTLFKLRDGSSIEAVLMLYDKRRTICISTQIGCSMGCVFCATGQMGFKRHLSKGEIIAQVLFFARKLILTGDVITNVVLMGMGEPFHNYINTLDAIKQLNDPEGYNLGSRRFTISTVGLVPAIRKFALEKSQVNLAISLHAADDSLRSSLLPINQTYPIDEILDASREYVSITKRRITFEWALIYDVNDTPEQAHLLGSKLKGLLCHVNAIPLNPTKKYEAKATTRQRALQFKTILKTYGIQCTIRLRRGVDINAGCGQLVSNNE
jgi:23S rRNA (adenine2503-C2)-methyltransferase